MQDCCNSIANASELLQSCAEPSKPWAIYFYTQTFLYLPSCSSGMRYRVSESYMHFIQRTSTLLSLPMVNESPRKFQMQQTNWWVCTWINFRRLYIIQIYCTLLWNDIMSLGSQYPLMVCQMHMMEQESWTIRISPMVKSETIHQILS